MPVISSSYARLTAVHPAVRVITGSPRSGGGWVPARDLAAGGAAVTEHVGWGAERLTRDHGRRPRPDVAATWGLHRYLWPACLLFTVPWFLTRRVPRLPVTAVSVHRATGRMTVRPEGFACLPGDPAARLPGARIVPTKEALRGELRAALAEHVAPLLDAFGPLLRRGPRALWGMATDEVAEGLWYVAGLLGAGEAERARRELTELLPGGTPPFAGGARFHRAVPTGRTGGDQPPGRPDQKTDAPSPRPETGRTRLTCCLFYTVNPAAACAGCPRRQTGGGIDHRAPAT